MKRYEATVEVTHEEWEAIQASFSVDLREGEEGYNEEVINKYDLRAGTNPIGLIFEFENGTKIYMGWYIEEFGGLVEWGDDNMNTLSTDYELELETEFTGSTEEDSACKYVCKIIVK